MTKLGNGENDMIKNSGTFPDNLSNCKGNLSRKTEMDRTDVKETGINNKDRIRKQLGRKTTVGKIPRLRWKDCVAKDVGKDRSCNTMEGNGGVR